MNMGGGGGLISIPACNYPSETNLNPLQTQTAHKPNHKAIEFVKANLSQYNDHLGETGEWPLSS